VPAGDPPSGESCGPVPSPGMRASDADRDQVIDVLREAVGDGRLTADEFEERLTAAMASRTFGELAALTADLVAPPALGQEGHPSTAPGESAAGVIRIRQRGGSVSRTGRWVVPRLMELRPTWCDVTLDFTDAIIAHDTLLIDMRMRGGILTLVAGPGIVVDAGALRVRYADVEMRPSAEPGAPVILRVELAGRMRYGRIDVQRPGRAAGW
jgi:hypothetical protein